MHKLGLRGGTAATVVALILMAGSPAQARGYHGHWHRHHDGISGGDLLAGALAIGGVAVIADAVSKSDRDRDVSDRDEPADTVEPAGRYSGPPPTRDYPEGPAPAATSYRDARDAMNACLARSDVGSVDAVAREGDGYRVGGRMRDGQGYTCWVGPEGQVDHLERDREPAS